MSLRNTITQEMTASMKAGDKIKLSTLRLLLSSVKYKEVDLKRELNDEEVQQVIATLVRQRQDSVEQFRKGNRADLADKEEKEIGILKAIGYRPKQIMGMFLSEAALTGILGAFCGLALGYALSFLMGGMLGGATPFGRGPGGAAQTIRPVFSSELLIFSLTFPVILATIAGLYPAWRASRMNAVVALKYE